MSCSSELKIGLLWISDTLLQTSIGRVYFHFPFHLAVLFLIQSMAWKNCIEGDTNNYRKKNYWFFPFPFSLACIRIREFYADPNHVQNLSIDEENDKVLSAVVPTMAWHNGGNRMRVKVSFLQQGVSAWEWVEWVRVGKTGSASCHVMWMCWGGLEISFCGGKAGEIVMISICTDIFLWQSNSIRSFEWGNL